MPQDQIIKIFDTTLRDGEQCPGASLNHEEKLQIARQLERLGVTVIEAGFPVASPDDWQAVNAIAKLVKKSIVCGLSRAVQKDIATCYEAIKPAKHKRIHTFLATSDLHLRYKLKMTRGEALERIAEMVKYARSLCADIEFSPEDGSRSDPKFLYQALETAIRAGASTLNIPDTVGYAYPAEFAKLIAGIKKNVRGIDKVTISVHCHDDLGLATANSLAAVTAGARQIECTVNGIGERAGNTALEEVVMALRVRRDTFSGLQTRIQTRELARTSRLVSQLTGFPVPPNKAIVGGNAFAHESGIHQDGILKKRETYEIMRATDIGLTQNKLVLGKHSGRAALAARLRELGFELPAAELADLFEKFKKLADQKKEVFDEDLEALVGEEIAVTQSSWQVSGVGFSATIQGRPSAQVVLINPAGRKVTAKSKGTGPVDAAYAAVHQLIGEPVKLLEFGMQAVTEGIDAQAVVTVRIESADGRTYTGRGADTDIVVASVKSFVHAINKVLAGKERIKAQL